MDSSSKVALEFTSVRALLTAFFILVAACVDLNFMRNLNLMLVEVPETAVGTILGRLSIRDCTASAILRLSTLDVLLMLVVLVTMLEFEAVFDSNISSSSALSHKGKPSIQSKYST